MVTAMVVHRPSCARCAYDIRRTKNKHERRTASDCSVAILRLHYSTVMTSEASIPGPLLTALQFAAAKHRNQRRKDADASPYINHPIAVAHLLATTGQVSDIAILMAAVLHDTIEGTETTPEELEAQFGAEAHRLVEEVTDDKGLEKQLSGHADFVTRAVGVIWTSVSGRPC